MHIPQGMLNGAICPVTGVVSTAVIGATMYFVLKSKERPKAKRFFVTMAVVFVMQMLNFPIFNGISGHFLGGVFAAFMLGTPLAALAMTAVIVIQSLLFGDGGVTALGANILNMVVAGTIIPGIMVNRLKTENKLKKYMYTAIISAGAVFLASIACAVEIGISGVVPIITGLTAMASVHAVIGIVEGVVTVLLIETVSSKFFKLRQFMLLLLSLILATPFANSNPDGLEWVVENFGKFKQTEMIYQPIFDRYLFSAISNEQLSTIISAFAGVVITGIIAVFYHKIQSKKLNKNK